MEYFKEMSMLEVIEKVRGQEIKSEELVRYIMGKIEEDEKLEDRLNALVLNRGDVAIEEAREADRRIRAGDIGKLSGIPVVIKDNLSMEGELMECGSRVLEGYRASYDATVVKRLKGEGAIIIGKSNMDEFAMGSSTEYSYRGCTRNPKDRERSPGGSSGGSSVAVSVGWVPVALGSDTGGSIRQPAAFCGVLGLKPTYGRVSRYGLVAFVSSLDQIGGFARNAEDLALVMDVISGHDEKDATSSEERVDFGDIQRDIQGKKIGIVKEYRDHQIDTSIKESLDKAMRRLLDLGCEVEEVSFPRMDFGIGIYYALGTAEAKSNLSRYDGVGYGRRVLGEDLESMYCQTRGEGFGMEVKRRIILGTYVLSSEHYDSYYKKAQELRQLIQEDFMRAFEKVDEILTPTTPTTAFRIGEKCDDPLLMYLSDIYTVNINLAGLPAISVPYGEDEQGLPIGIQLIGSAFQERGLLNTAWHLQNKL